jgi:hypothetical protein
LLSGGNVGTVSGTGTDTALLNDLEAVNLFPLDGHVVMDASVPSCSANTVSNIENPVLHSTAFVGRHRRIHAQFVSKIANTG